MIGAEVDSTTGVLCPIFLCIIIRNGILKLAEESVIIGDGETTEQFI